MSHTITVDNPDDLLAAVPHLLGFEPAESLIVVPVSEGLPVARIDIPRTPEDRETVTSILTGPLAGYASPGARVALVCATEDGRAAEEASRAVGDGLRGVGIEVMTRLWAGDRQWVELDTGAAGNRTAATAGRLAAEAVIAGHLRPAPSRESLAAAMTGDRRPVADALPAARAAAERTTDLTERNWALARLEQFHDDGNRLSDPDAARLLLAVKSTTVRDALWEDMTQQNATTHVALWTDLTRRAPDDVRTPAATLLAFSAWLKGNGAQAWCALDQVPQGESYSMANRLAMLLQSGASPDVWERSRAVAEVAEGYAPQPRPPRPELDLGGHRPCGPAPGGPRR